MRKLLLLLPIWLHAASLTLATQMETAEPGDYLVTQQHRTITVLLVREHKGDELTLEEISAPARRGKPVDVSWANWIEDGAPRHTSWIGYTVNEKTGDVSKSYSYSRKGWITSSQRDQFLSTLITLKFEDIPTPKRKKVGPPPRGARSDKRKLWEPPLVFEGRCYRDLPFHAWTAHWPRDGSQLAGREIVVYTPAVDGPYPQHFPYWVEIYPAPGDNKIRVTDSGKGLQSPKPKLSTL